MAFCGWLIWSSLLLAAQPTAAAALAECDASSLVQGQTALKPWALFSGQTSRRDKDSPVITQSNYWMFNFAKHRSKAAVAKSIAAMENITASANAFPVFTLPSVDPTLATNGIPSKKLLEKLKGAYTSLKHNLTLHQKGQSHQLFTIHTSLPLEIQMADGQFQDRWKTVLHDVASAIHRHRAYLAMPGAASQLCVKSAEFMEDFHWQVGNYTRLMTRSLENLPPELPPGNGFINSTALETRRAMYASSRDMMNRLELQVKVALPAFLAEVGSCDRTTPQPEPESKARQQQSLKSEPQVPQQAPAQQQRRRKTPWPDIEYEPAVLDRVQHKDEQRVAQQEEQHQAQEEELKQEDGQTVVQQEEQQQTQEEQPKQEEKQQQKAEPQQQQQQQQSSALQLRSCRAWFLLATLCCSYVVQ